MNLFGCTRCAIGRAVALLFALTVIAGCAPSHEFVSPADTIVIISIDTTRRDHLSVYGYPRRTTPYLEVLAADSVVFEQAIAVHSNTAPSHASILTGLYPPQHGSINNAVPIAPDVPTLAEILTSAGYDTAAFISGKTLKAEDCGLDRGFEKYDDHFKGWERRAETTLELARRWLLGRDADRPVFLFFHLFDPHFLYSPPTRFSNFGLEGATQPPEPTNAEELRNSTRRNGERWDRDMAEWTRRYDAEIAYADWAVGELLSTLQQLDRYSSATIVVVSDHGETLAERPRVLDHGCRVTEEQIRVPLIIKFSDRGLAGTRVAEQVSQIDITPTILRRIDRPAPADSPGVDLRKFAANPTAAPPRPLFSMARREPDRLSDLGFEVPQPRRWNGPESQLVSVRLPPFKLVDYGFQTEDGVRRLRNLTIDPLETGFVDDPEVTRSYGEMLDRWWLQNWSDERASAFELSRETTEMLEALGYMESSTVNSASDAGATGPTAVFESGFEDGDATAWDTIDGSGDQPD